MRLSNNPWIIANWKMHKTSEEALAFVAELAGHLKTIPTTAQIVLCPPYTLLSTVSKAIEGTPIELGAQNMHYAPLGAFTGEISVTMLREFFVRYVILGHSERRALFQETDALINQKLKAAFEANLIPILCIGETAQEQSEGKTQLVIERQLEGAFKEIAPHFIQQLLIAYEPVWAIGTGKVATPETAQFVHRFIRKMLTERFGQDAKRVPILYGGSVNPENARALFEQEEIAGGLIGGASLSAKAFSQIVQTAIA